MELTHWFGMICIFLNKRLLQWWKELTVFGWFVFFWIRDCSSGWIDSLILDDMCFFYNKLPQWWNWIIYGGWFVFFWIRDCRSGGIYSLILDDFCFSLYAIAAVADLFWISRGFLNKGFAALVEWTHWFWMFCAFLNKGLQQLWIDSLMMDNLHSF